MHYLDSSTPFVTTTLYGRLVGLIQCDEVICPQNDCSQLVYQTTVFLSRSSISLGLPPLPSHLFYLPAVTQAVILAILSLESGVGIIPQSSETAAVAFVFILISLEGICGGSA